MRRVPPHNSSPVRSPTRCRKRTQAEMLEALEEEVSGSKSTTHMQRRGGGCAGSHFQGAHQPRPPSALPRPTATRRLMWGWTLSKPPPKLVEMLEWMDRAGGGTGGSRHDGALPAARRPAILSLAVGNNVDFILQHNKSHT